MEKENRKTYVHINHETDSDEILDGILSNIDCLIR